MQFSLLLWAVITSIFVRYIGIKMSRERSIGFSGGFLKWVAVISMLLDHIGVVWVDRSIAMGKETEVILNSYYILRMLGRIAFPIFCFFIVEGFVHTHNVKKYAMRLGIFALLSEIPFDFAAFGAITAGYQNVYFTLLIGLLVLIVLQKIQQTQTETTKKFFFCAIVIILGSAGAYLMHSDYDCLGVLLIVSLYLLRSKRIYQCIVGCCFFLSQPTAMFSFFLLYFYNGQRGRGGKKFFYWFYPIHLLLLHSFYLLFYINRVK